MSLLPGLSATTSVGEEKQLVAEILGMRLALYVLTCCSCPPGHVDAGKSTLMGHLLFLKGQVSKKTMHKYCTLVHVPSYTHTPHS